MKQFLTHGQRMLALVAGSLLTTSALAQSFQPASVQEGYMPGNGSVTSVVNTGAAMGEAGGTTMQLGVWDGTMPSFGWKYNGGAVSSQKLQAVINGLIVSDPDIVTYYNPSTARWCMLAVYLAKTSSTAPNSVRYEVQQYNPGTNSWSVVTAPTRIDNGTTAPCTSPNVDVNRRTGDAVMVFEQNRRIYGRDRSIPGALYPLRLLACSSLTVGHRQPDVALYEDTQGGSVPSVASVVYVTENTATATLEVDLLQEPLTTMQTGSSTCVVTPPNTQVAYGAGSTVSNTEILDAPRIAAPQFGPSSWVDSYDCMVAVRYNDGFGDQILTLTRKQAVYGSAISAQSQNALTASYANTRPVVTYIGDGAFLAWQYDDTGVNILNGNTDILGMWLKEDGTPTSISASGDLLVANRQVVGQQVAPSVEGRYSPANLTSEGLVLWHDQARRDIAFKPLSWYAYSLRNATGSAAPTTPAAIPVTQLSVYPNPAKANADTRATVRLAPGETVQSLTVVQAQTGRVVAELPTTSIREGQSEVAMPKLPAGLYLLRLLTDKGTRATRFVSQP